MTDSSERNPYANTAAVSKTDAALLETPTGREDDRGAADHGRLNNDELQRLDVGAVPMSTVTARRQPGTGADETEDGLSDNEEALRRAAEDIGNGDERLEAGDLPVFDRGIAPPKI
jgi:hypothetical protein